MKFTVHNQAIFIWCFVRFRLFLFLLLHSLPFLHCILSVFHFPRYKRCNWNLLCFSSGLILCPYRTLSLYPFGFITNCLEFVCSDLFCNIILNAHHLFGIVRESNEIFNKIVKLVTVFGSIQLFSIRIIKFTALHF